MGFLRSIFSKKEDSQSINSIAVSTKKIGLNLNHIFSNNKTHFNDELFDELLDALIMSDVGAKTSESLIIQLKKDIANAKTKEIDFVYNSLVESVVSFFEKNHTPLLSFGEQDGPLVIFMVGVNGVGKTTSTAKIARYYQSQGAQVMLAACDTFRSAAIEQLTIWGHRLDIPVVSHSHGSDPAAVIHDAYGMARSEKKDVLLVDTAGRQHTDQALMHQIKKMERVLKKTSPSLPHEVLITLDATNGQNILSQVKHFNQTISLTGVVVTKLDGNSKGGALIAMADQFGLPIKAIGVGEKIDDLANFDPKKFGEALLRLPSKP